MVSFDLDAKANDTQESCQYDEFTTLVDGNVWTSGCAAGCNPTGCPEIDKPNALTLWGEVKDLYRDDDDE